MYKYIPELYQGYECIHLLFPEENFLENQAGHMSSRHNQVYCKLCLCLTFTAFGWRSILWSNTPSLPVHNSSLMRAVTYVI